MSVPLEKHAASDSSGKVERQRIVLITPSAGRGEFGGLALRIQRWIDELEQEAELWQLVVRRSGVLNPDDCDHWSGPAEQWMEVPVVADQKQYRLRQVATMLRTLRPGDRSGCIGWRREWAFLNRESETVLRNGLGDRSFDRVICFRLYCRDVARWVVENTSPRPALVELDFDDYESRTRASIGWRMIRNGDWSKGLPTLADAVWTALVERRLLGEFDKVWLASSDDAERLNRKRWTPIVGTRPNLTPDQSAAESRLAPITQVLFVGTWSYYPNWDAMRFLVKDVWPRLRQDGRDWRLVLVGRDGSDLIRRELRGVEGVEFRGEVENLSTAYAQAGLVVAPVRCGGGTKVKVLEAMAHGCPVIAGRHARRGLPIRRGEHYWEAESAEDYVRQLRCAADNVENARALGDRGRRWIRAWRQQVQQSGG